MNIFQFLQYKTELWNDKIISKDNYEQFNIEIEQLTGLWIIIGQSVDFYEKLGGKNVESFITRIIKKYNKKSSKKKKPKDVEY